MTHLFGGKEKQRRAEAPAADAKPSAAAAVFADSILAQPAQPYKTTDCAICRHASSSGFAKAANDRIFPNHFSILRNSAPDVRFLSNIPMTKNRLQHSCRSLLFVKKTQ